jgi:hypothetical protein
MSFMNTSFRRYLERCSPLIFSVIAGTAAFSAYFAMYAFRKPFAAATYPMVTGWSFSIDFKIALVLAQVAGYACSKMVGIKFISELDPKHRSVTLIGLIVLAWLALVLFAVTPAPWSVLTLFLNGLPLGMIWGLVFGYLEGRRTSEVLGTVLCASLIVSSGAVKTVGKIVMDSWHVSPFWMPAVAGALFFPLLFLSVWVLSAMPPPSALDEAARVRRIPMNAAARYAFLAVYGLGVGLLVAAYIFATALRDFRDNFAAELWNALGHGNGAAIFTASELPVAILALATLGLIIMVRNNTRAVMIIHAVIISGFALLGLSTIAFQAGWLGPITWMILSGAGLYMAYTPFNAMLFDRLIAFSGRAGTAGFLIYLADSFGYVGSCGLLIWRNFGLTHLNWLQVFTVSIYVTSLVGAALVVSSALFFIKKSQEVPITVGLV